MEIEQKPAKRPIGVLVLAVWYFANGCGFLVVNIGLIADHERLSTNLSTNLVLLLLVGAFLGVLALGASVGLFSVKAWGWWLAAFYNLYGIFQDLSALITALILTDSSTPNELYTRFVIVRLGQILIHALVLIYLYRARVLMFFGFRSFSKRRTFLVLFAVNLILYVVASALRVALEV